MTNSQTAGNAAFSDALFHALAKAMSDACGAPWLVAALPDAQPAAEEAEPVRLNLGLDGALQGECQLEFRRSEAISLASKCLGETATEFAEPQSAALLKMVEAAGADFTAGLASRYGAFTLQASLASEALANAAGSAEMTAGDDGGNRASIKLLLSAPLDQALAARAESEPEAEDSTKPEIGELPPLQLPEAMNLDLVMDVELNVTLRFGQRQLALREVLELTSGSVIELDRQVEEPVELLLEGKVIARGEAVVIDGNYGLRVTEVPQPVSPPFRH
jgi:flagellar motor switch protein FliN